MKTCSTCKLDLELSKFTKDKNKKDGLKINCIDCCKSYWKNYFSNNRESEKMRSKKYNKEKRKLDKESIKLYKQKYYQDNKEDIKIKRKKYFQDNKEVLNKKRKMNILRYLNTILGSNIRRSLKSINCRKKTKTQDILGCSIEEFRSYLESKFEYWMNWENWGKYDGKIETGWDIDHVIPISSATTEEEIIKLNHYTNLQPLCSYTNRYVKGNKMNYM